MNQLAAAYRKVLRKKNYFYRWLITAFVFFWNLWNLNNAAVPLSWGLVGSLAVGGMLMWHLYRKACKAEEIILRRLTKPEDAGLFQRTIDAEMSSASASSVQDDQYGMYLFVTETWLILLTTGDSFVRRAKEKVSAEMQFNPGVSESSVHITFSDGETFGFFCHDNLEEVSRLLSAEERGAQET